MNLNVTTCCYLCKRSKKLRRGFMEIMFFYPTGYSTIPDSTLQGLYWAALSIQKPCSTLSQPYYSLFSKGGEIFWMQQLQLAQKNCFVGYVSLCWQLH